jgi:MarR family transcriptional regulator, organic hydroperoxide resistance regulator
MPARTKPEKKTRVSADAEPMERDLSAIRRMMRKPLADEFAKGGLTVPQKAVMQIVVGREGISLKELSREVSLAHSTVSGIVDRLEKQGLIERRTDVGDARVSQIHSSAPVKEFLRDKMPALSRGPLSAALERASADERRQIGRALRRLRELLERT